MWASEDCCISDLYVIGPLESLFINTLSQFIGKLEGSSLDTLVDSGVAGIGHGRYAQCDGFCFFL